MSPRKKKLGIWAWLLIALSLLMSPVIVVVSLTALLATFTARETESKCYADQSNTYMLPTDVSLSGSPKFDKYQHRFDIYPDGEDIKAEQRKIVKIILGVAESRGLDEYDKRLGLATAMQESDLRNLNRGHWDSKGVFQQRPSQDWGTEAQVTDPVYATNAFYAAAEKITDRKILPLIETALRVQRPDPAAYRSRWEWDPIATELVAAESRSASSATDTTAKQALLPRDPTCQGTDTTVTLAISAAQLKLNRTYEWKDPESFDGSSLTAWAYGTVGTKLPLKAKDQFETGTTVKKADLKPGDLVFWADDPANKGTINKVAMWMGSDKVLQAPEASGTVQVVAMNWDRYIGAKRPIADPKIIENSNNSSLAPGALTAPLKPGSYTKSSPFSMRVNPITGVNELHNGVDLAAPAGTPIYSVCDCIVTSTEWQDTGGNVTFIKDKEGHTFGFGHQQSRAPHIKVGITVKAGEVIGYVGTTGGSTGNHLHFMIMMNSGKGLEFFDPIPFMTERGIIL